VGRFLSTSRYYRIGAEEVSPRGLHRLSQDALILLGDNEAVMYRQYRHAAIHETGNDGLGDVCVGALQTQTGTGAECAGQLGMLRLDRVKTCLCLFPSAPVRIPVNVISHSG